MKIRKMEDHSARKMLIFAHRGAERVRAANTHSQCVIIVAKLSVNMWQDANASWDLEIHNYTCRQDPSCSAVVVSLHMQENKNVQNQKQCHIHFGANCLCAGAKVSGTPWKPDIEHLVPASGTEVYSNADRQTSSCMFDGWKRLWSRCRTSVAKVTCYWRLWPVVVYNM